MTDPTHGSIGVYLGRQRRLRGISLDDLAESTKIPRRSIERLEAGAFDGQSDGFARGFVRTIADALGLDSEDSINRLLGEPPDADDESSNHRVGITRWLALALGATIAAGLILAAGWLWQRSSLLLPAADEIEIVYRRDAVRALALEQAEHPAGPPSPERPQQTRGPGVAREVGVGIERDRDDSSN